MSLEMKRKEQCWACTNSQKEQPEDEGSTVYYTGLCLLQGQLIVLSQKLERGNWIFRTHNPFTLYGGRRFLRSEVDFPQEMEWLQDAGKGLNGLLEAVSLQWEQHFIKQQKKRLNNFQYSLYKSDAAETYL
jgi:hypothetical protein